MATVNTTKAPDNTSDTTFRAWCQAIHDLFIAGGWVETTDTGQMNLSTVTAPGSANTFQGYKIYRSNDASGGIVEIYAKVEFGSGNTSAVNIGIALTLGWSSDGAGNLNGLTSARTVLNGTSYTATPRSFIGSCGAGYFVLGWCMDIASQYAFLIGIERGKDSTFADMNKLLISTSAVSSYRTQVVLRTGTSGGLPVGTAYAVETTSYTYEIIPNVTNSIVNGNVGLGLKFFQEGGFTHPSTIIFGVNSTQLGVMGTTQTIPINGVNKTFIVLGATSNTGFGISSTNPYVIRYE